MINLSMAEPDNMLRPRLTVIGVGGAGGNAINNMIRSCLEGCDFVVANTDAQALAMSLAPRKLQLGTNLSRGLGAGSKPEVGRAAAEETMADIMSILDGSDMIFVTAGMGGGTGTGAAPVIARAAREAGILTVGVVTKPFHFEGTHRMRQAEAGIAELQQYVDTLIVIPNQNLFRIANERTTFAEAFRMADEVLNSGVRGITDLMVMPGFMNLDFADVKTVMAEMGKAMMGTGEAEGDNRSLLAAEAAISNPLLDDISMKGARGVLINITGGMDMTLFEVDQAANRIREEVDPEAQIKVGSTLGENMDGRIRVSVIATGIDAALEERERKAVEARLAAGGAPRGPVMAQQQQREPVKAAPLPTSMRTSPVTAGAGAQAQQQQAQQPQQQQTAAQAQQMQVQQTAPFAPEMAEQPRTNMKTTASYFSMPSAIVPGGQKIPTSSVTMRPMPEAAARQEESEIEAEEMASEDDVRALSETNEGGYAAQQQGMAPSSQTYQSAAQSPAASYHQSVPVQPSLVREIPPVQQAQRQRTAQAAPVHGETAATPDMRMTQLTTAAPAKAAPSVNQRAQSLFQRITGFGLVRPSQSDMDDEIDQEVEQAVQSSLSVDPSDRPVMSSSEADLLDIPAFLRRQSNH